MPRNAQRGLEVLRFHAAVESRAVAQGEPGCEHAAGDARRYTIRFTPRKPKSVWSTVNTKHVGGAYARTFRANKKAWRFFQTQPPGYRRIASWWVMSAKKEETRRRRELGYSCTRLISK